MPEGKKKHPIVLCFALGAITIIELYALKQGIDGKMMAFSMIVIGGIAGYSFDIFKPQLKEFAKSFLKVLSQNETGGD